MFCAEIDGVLRPDTACSDELVVGSSRATTRGSTATRMRVGVGHEDDDGGTV